tara:strand:- start:2333 stop:2449 length:117 start_codon:yes stop_codon:yes gene_type:complete
MSKSKRSKNAAKVLFSWRKAMPYYYAIAIIIVAIIIII